MTSEERTEQKQNRIIECAQYHEAGWEDSLIAAKMHVDIKTVRRYLRYSGYYKTEPRTIVIMQGAIYPEEIEAFKQRHSVGDTVKIFRLIGSKRQEIHTEIIEKYTHIARTAHGCIRWADLVRYDRNIMEGQE